MRAVEPCTDWLLAIQTDRETNARNSRIDEWHKEDHFVTESQNSFVHVRFCG